MLRSVRSREHTRKTNVGSAFSLRWLRWRVLSSVVLLVEIGPLADSRVSEDEIDTLVCLEGRFECFA